MPQSTRLPVHKFAMGQSMPEITEDHITMEEPLEIRLQYGPAANRRCSSISITMRTPGQDDELAAGFLFTEGIIKDGNAIQQLTTEPPNNITVALHEDIPYDTAKLQRHFYTTSSCGVCGKTSIESLYQHRPHRPSVETEPVPATLIYSLPASLRQHQDVFNTTGGLHAAALFDRNGRPGILREDIGRHNALDKVIGYHVLRGLLPPDPSILLLSGRACFELLQKASMAGITIVVAIGPPSSLAVELAESADITLIGFLRDQRFNVYTGAHRIRT